MIALASLLVAGCVSAPAVRLSESDRATIRAVAIAPDVGMPKEIYFSGRAQAFSAGIGGAVGALIGNSIAKEPKDRS